jgi:hypothetical protein
VVVDLSKLKLSANLATKSNKLEILTIENSYLYSYSMPLDHYHVRLTDKEGEELVSVRRAPKGTIRFSLSFPSSARTMCGWVWKVSESVLSSAWKKRWYYLCIKIFNESC